MRGRSQLAGRCQVGTTFPFVLGVSEWTASCLPWTASIQTSTGVPLGHLEGGHDTGALVATAWVCVIVAMLSWFPAGMIK